MKLEQLAFFVSVLVGLEVAVVTRTCSGTFTGSGRCQSCFLRNLSRTLTLLVVEFEIIIVITHE